MNVKSRWGGCRTDGLMRWKDGRRNCEGEKEQDDLRAILQCGGGGGCQKRRQAREVRRGKDGWNYNLQECGGK